MPDYLLPGVFIDEGSFGKRPIEGVATSIAALLGPTRKGPVSGGAGAPESLELLTSFQDFQRIYGGVGELVFGGVSIPNYLALAVRAFFDEGGSRLYVSRVVVTSKTSGDGGATSAQVAVPGPGGAVSFHARFAGAAGNGLISVEEVFTSASVSALDAAPDGTLALSGAGSAPVHHLKKSGAWIQVSQPPEMDQPEKLEAKALAARGAVIITIRVTAEDGDGDTMVLDDVGFDVSHPRGITRLLSAEPSGRSERLYHAFAIRVSSTVTAAQLHQRLLAGGSGAMGNRRRSWDLAGGTDGTVPSAPDYADALWEVERCEDVATVAAPGSSAYGDADAARAVMNALIRHCEAPGAYRMAVLDPPPNQSLAEVRALRAQIDSRHAALYYPWVVVPNPNGGLGGGGVSAEIALPPSGFLCGIYARTDARRGVHKAPANEVVNSAIRFESDVTHGEQEILNPLGVNCLRLVPGRGHRVWGARLISSDPEWRYVSQRRFFNYLGDSIERGTQWVVFEPNGEALWAQVRQVIGDFLDNEWRGGALLGATAEKAFFVRCDRSTMTQDDMDNGRLVCMVGVAMLRPAEFVIFRIGQKTAGAGA